MVKMTTPPMASATVRARPVREHPEGVDVPRPPDVRVRGRAEALLADPGVDVPLRLRAGKAMYAHRDRICRGSIRGPDPGWHSAGMGDRLPHCRPTCAQNGLFTWTVEECTR